MKHFSKSLVFRARFLRNVRMTALLTAAGALASSTVSSYQASTLGPVTWGSVANGLVDGGLIFFLLGFYTLIFVELIAHRWFHRRSFALVLAVNTLAYLFLILFGRALGRAIMQETRFELIPLEDAAARAVWLQSVLLGMIASFVLNFMYQNGRLLGQRVLFNFITGQYHRPRTERRIVMFLDLADSTGIAERIGDARYLRFLERFFLDMTPAILDTGAEIYKYVGDEVILTWSPRQGTRHQNCLLFYYRFLATIQEHRTEYLDEFAVLPRFRAGLHMGSMAVGEIGDLKREIALIGDVLNSTARILEQCRVVGAPFLVSGDLAPSLEDQGPIALRPAGSFTPRGKETEMRIFIPSLPDDADQVPFASGADAASS